jgi:putative nucleotidyltransferase with HDIG domain
MLASISSDLKSSDLLRGDLQLTSSPGIYLELQKTIADPDKSIADIGFIIEQDPALSIRTLKIVNSVFFGFPAQITSIKRAITVIGTQELQNLVLASVIIDKFSSMPNGLLSMQDFWARSLHCALISKELCIHSNNKDDLDSIFICGLLHDIGQLIFYRRIPELARQIGLLIELNGADEIEAENHILGFNHYQTGAELARLWKLPEIIVETISQHNHPDYKGIFANAASIVRIANYLGKMDLEKSDLKNFCKGIVTEDELGDIVNKVREQFEAIFKLFYPK